MVNPTTLSSPLAKGQEVRNPQISYDPTLKTLTVNGTVIPLGDTVSYDADTGVITINTTDVPLGDAVTYDGDTNVLTVGEATVPLTPDTSELDDGVYQLTVTSGVASWTSV